MKRNWSSFTKSFDIALNRGNEGKKKREGHLSKWQCPPQCGYGLFSRVVPKCVCRNHEYSFSGY